MGSEEKSAKTIEQTSKTNRVLTAITTVLSVALLFSMGSAALYGLHYGNVDESVATGSIEILRNDKSVISITVNENKNASVGYRGYKMIGTLKLAGAERDTILFQMKGIAFVGVPGESDKKTASDNADTPNTQDELDANNMPDASDAVLFIRMPRPGLQGDYSGQWAAYFSCPSQNIKHSFWLFANDDGTALLGDSGTSNPMVLLRSKLFKNAVGTTWEKRESTLIISNSE